MTLLRCSLFAGYIALAAGAMGSGDHASYRPMNRRM